MLNLMKYEFFKRKKLLITTLIIFFFLELSIVIGIKLGGAGWVTVAVISFVLLVVGGMLFPFLDTVINYFSDFKNKNGYMLFLTPNKGSSILGAKVLFLLIEVIIMALLVGSVVRIDAGILFNVMNKSIGLELAEAGDAFKMILGVDTINFWNFVPLLILGLVQYMTSVMVAIFSITVAKTILSSKDFNWLMALLFYIAIAVGMQFIYGGVLLASGLPRDAVMLVEQEGKAFLSFNKYLYIGYALYTAVFATLFPISANLINKRTDM